LACSWEPKYQVLVTFTKGTDVERDLFILLKLHRRPSPIVLKS
jgi:hypothetical protein